MGATMTVNDGLEVVSMMSHAPEQKKKNNTESYPETGTVATMFV